MGLAKVQLSMWVKRKKTKKMVITPEEFEEVEDIPEETYEILVEKAFNSKMMGISQGSNIAEILEKMFVYVKMQIENPALPMFGFTLDSIMHLDKIS